jgi:hypothetical protein
MYVLSVRLAQDLHNWRGWCYRRHRLVRELENRPAYAEYGIDWTAVQRLVQSTVSTTD